MNTRPIAVLALASALLLAGLSACSRPAPPDSDFARAVDLEHWGKVAVLHEGRLKSFDSFARTLMNAVTGPRSYKGQSPSFTLLDLAIRPDAYAEADVIYVKNKPMRAQIVRALAGTHAAEHPGWQARMDAFLEQGLISEALLQENAVFALLETLRQDLMRTARLVEALDSAAFVMSPQFLLGNMRVVPPPGGDERTQWLSLQELVALGDAPAVAAFPPAQRETINAQYLAMFHGWRAQDAAAVNTALASLADSLAEVEPALYPSQSRLEWESWYFKARGMTWVWLLYLPAVILLLLSLVYHWRPARTLGMGCFLLAFGFHSFALGLRWYVADRWPNSNMFEAVTTAAWFGCIAALALEWIGRRTALRNMFALGGAVAAMVALMAVHFLPVTLSSNIGNMMPVLHDVWLYIHTNVIIASYCLIFMAAVSALLYLGYRVFGGRAEFATMGGAGTLMAGGGPAGAIVSTGTGTGAGTGTGDSRGASAGQVFDGVTMVLMELSFVMLWAGLVMGAIWADHSWGRPWGWDPKEVFALNTFLIFAVLVHVRLKARDKGLWTAVLAVVGAGVMLFNWIVINFVITGLHSYA
jgi:cytochrome c-type biogenesis protein CcsB